MKEIEEKIEEKIKERNLFKGCKISYSTFCSTIGFKILKTRCAKIEIGPYRKDQLEASEIYAKIMVYSDFGGYSCYYGPTYLNDTKQ